MTMDKSTINALRQKYGKIYRTTYNGKYYVFRSLTIGEFEYLTTAHSLDNEDAVAKALIVYPEDVDIDTMPAGFVAAILNEALEVCHFSDPKQANDFINAAREQSSMVIPMMKSFILAARPMTNTKDLDKLTFDELVLELVLAEKILEIISNVTNPSVESITFSIPDPDEMAEQEANRDPVKERLLKAMEGIA